LSGEDIDIYIYRNAPARQGGDLPTVLLQLATIQKQPIMISRVVDVKLPGIDSDNWPYILPVQFRTLDEDVYSTIFSARLLDLKNEFSLEDAIRSRIGTRLSQHQSSNPGNFAMGLR